MHQSQVTATLFDFDFCHPCRDRGSCNTIPRDGNGLSFANHPTELGVDFVSPDLGQPHLRRSKAAGVGDWCFGNDAEMVNTEMFT